MTVTRQEQAMQMRADGVPVAEIAATFGVAPSTVSRWTVPASEALDRATSLANKRRYRGVCENCGGSTNGSAGPGKAARVYRRCYTSDDRYAERRHVVAQAQVLKWADRRSYIVKRWNNGASLKVIAAELGSTPANVAVTVTKLRKQGYPVPYRNKSYGGLA